MDVRRSFYLASKQNDFAEPAPDPRRLNCSDIPYVMGTNDNLRVKERLLVARCGDLLRRLIGLHRGNWPY